MKYYEVKCTLQPFCETAVDLLSAALAEIGFESFSPTEDGLLAYIQRNEWSEAAMQEVVGNFFLPDVEIRYALAEAPDEDWNQVWEEEGFQPIIIPEASLVSSKRRVKDEEATHVISPLEGQGEIALIVVHDVKHTDVPPAHYDIVITPRMAFGTGSHETTRLILRTLAQLDLKDKHVIDAGTGTGILAIMAIKRGAASVFAYDIDEWSVENTKDNLLLNHVPTMGQGARSKGQENRNQSRDGSRDSILLPLAPCSLPPSPRVEVAIGDSSVLEGQAKVNLLIANINRNILLQDLPRFAKVVKEKGRMILSGFYLSDVPVLAEAAVQQGFSLLKTESEGEWAMLLFEADALGGRDV